MINTPISENGFFGVALGAAMMGLRPIADLQYADFALLAMDQIVNQIAKMRYMSGGKITVPLTMRAPIGVTGRGAQHSQSIEPFLLPSPGIKIVCPATAYDAVGLLAVGRPLGRSGDDLRAQAALRLEGARVESGSVDASSEIPDEDYTVPWARPSCAAREPT